MEKLFDLGFTEEQIINMINICPNIKDLEKEEIEEKIEILKTLNCNNRHIKNIIESNPNYLDRISEDIKKTIKKLIDLGFTSINILLDSNPLILNIDEFEIDEYINERMSSGELLEDIVDDLETKTYLFNEF